MGKYQAIKPLHAIAILMLALSLHLFGDGFIIIEPPYPPPPRPVSPPQPSATLFPLVVKEHHVSVSIENLAATTRIDQTFYNPTATRLQGYYLFPLPQGVSITKFSMYIDGKETEAELLEAGKARQLYEDIVRKAIDPALLEYSGQGVLRVKVFPIEPRAKKRIKVTYSEVLARDNGTVEYLYPLNTEKFSARPLNEVSIKVDIHAPNEITNVYCPTHETDIHYRDERNVVVGYEAENVQPERDFKLYYNSDESEIGLSLQTYRRGGEDGFFFLNISPGSGADRHKIAEKDITIVLDVSGSMAGDKLSQARRALLFCIANLNEGDRFEIIRFSTEAEALFRELKPASEASKQEAEDYIAGLKAIGGTNIEAALKLALPEANETERPHFLIFITDGKPTIGETDENALLQTIRNANIADTRIFTFGIGHDINTHLLDKITEYSRAYRTYISPEEDLEVKISNFYTKVAFPILTDLNLTVNGAVRINQVYPVQMPDLFRGTSLTLLGRYRGMGKADITLSGKINGMVEKFKYSSDFPDKAVRNDFLPPLWASRAIGYMLDQIRLHGESEELKQEVIQLARTYGIITPYTSYLIVEDETERVTRNELRPQYQLLRQKMLDSPDLMQAAEEDYSQLRRKSGSGSVRSSEDVQYLGSATNLAQTTPGASRLSYQGAGGRQQNLSNQYRMVHGRAVYQNGVFWVDSKIQAHQDARVIRIEFASEAYFELLAEHPETAEFLALGREVRFWWENRIYEVYEQGD